MGHDSEIDWALLEHPMHRGLHRLVRDLNRLYRSTPALYERDCEPDGFSWIDAANGNDSVLSYMRWSADGQGLAVIVCNFTPVPRQDYRIGAPRPGRYRERVNTDARDYGGSGIGNLGAVEAEATPMHGQAYSLRLWLPPLATLIFTLE